MRNKRTVARGHTKEFTFGSVPLSSSSVLPQKTPAENGDIISFAYRYKLRLADKTYY